MIEMSGIENQIYLITGVALFFGICLFLVSYRFVLNGMRLYQVTFLHKMDTGLKDAFIRMDAKSISRIGLVSINCDFFL